jgi:hypothetical protein
MNASHSRYIVAAASSAVMCWATAASAQSVMVQGAPAQPAPAVVPAAPPPSTPVVVNNQAPAGAPGPAVVEAPPAAEADTGTYWRPNRYMLMSGLIVAGAPYIASVSVAATSSNSNDNDLYIPAFGPWLDLGQRGGCPASGSCAGEVGNKVLLIGDGILQSVGVLEILGAFIFPETGRVSTTVQTGKNGSWVAFSPANMGVGGYGMSAVGQF